MNKRKCGGKYEDIAAKHLEAIGYRIIERNYRCRAGEIDLIAADKGTIVFVEVKYRKGSGSGYPEEAVTPYKQRRISFAASFFCMMNHIPGNVPCRFDVVAIDNQGLRHYKNAFMYAL